MPRMLSPHFSLEEMTFSETAARLGLDNTPSAEVLRNLRRLCSALEDVRTALGDVPIRVTSGYRSLQVNRAVGGAQNSAHTRGLAVDFVASQFGTVLATAKAVAASGVPFEQVIFEYGRWVHLAITEESQVAKGELLSIGSGFSYVPGLRTV